MKSLYMVLALTTCNMYTYATKKEGPSFFRDCITDSDCAEYCVKKSLKLNVEVTPTCKLWICLCFPSSTSQETTTTETPTTVRTTTTPTRGVVVNNNDGTFRTTTAGPTTRPLMIRRTKFWQSEFIFGPLEAELIKRATRHYPVRDQSAVRLK